MYVQTECQTDMKSEIHIIWTISGCKLIVFYAKQFFWVINIQDSYPFTYWCGVSFKMAAMHRKSKVVIVSLCLWLRIYFGPPSQVRFPRYALSLRSEKATSNYWSCRRRLELLQSSCSQPDLAQLLKQELNWAQRQIWPLLCFRLKLILFATTYFCILNFLGKGKFISERTFA